MPAPLVGDQEFVVHLFAPREGPDAQAAYRQLERVWGACREQLGMTQPIARQPGPALPPAGASGPATDRVLAVAEGQTDIRQAVLRQVHDVVNLSVALAQASPDGQRARSRRRFPAIGSAAAVPRRLGWTDYATMWARVSQPPSDALLGEAHLYLARTPRKNGRVEATAELGEALDALLPYRDDRPRKWWQSGITTTAGFALWDTGLAADTAALREIVLVAGADQDDELSTWAWSDRSAAMPPFARYLMHAAKLRYEARVLDRWHSAPPDQDIDGLAAEVDAALEPAEPVPGRAELLGSLRARSRAEEARLKRLETDLRNLGQTVSIAQRNLAAQPGCDTGAPAGLFAADQSLADWLTGQIGSDREYLQIQLDLAKSVREYVTEEAGAAGGSSGSDGPGGSGGPGGSDGPGGSGRSGAGSEAAATSAAGSDGAAGEQADATGRVFIVHGRDAALAKGFFELLSAVGLKPLEWERLVRPMGTATPYLGEVVKNAPHQAQATLVLLSPDDIVELHPDLRLENDHGYEKDPGGQARPNVLFELGLAYMAYPERTVIVEVGRLRPIADLAGLNTIHFDGSAAAIKKTLDRLVVAGCQVDLSGDRWLDPDRFAHLATYHRGPGTGKAAGDGGT